MRHTTPPVLVEREQVRVQAAEELHDWRQDRPRVAVAATEAVAEVNRRRRCLRQRSALLQLTPWERQLVRVYRRRSRLAAALHEFAHDELELLVVAVGVGAHQRLSAA